MAESCICGLDGKLVVLAALVWLGLSRVLGVRDALLALLTMSNAPAAIVARTPSSTVSGPRLVSHLRKQTLCG